MFTCQDVQQNDCRTDCRCPQKICTGFMVQSEIKGASSPIEEHMQEDKMHGLCTEQCKVL